MTRRVRDVGPLAAVLLVAEPSVGCDGCPGSRCPKSLVPPNDPQEVLDVSSYLMEDADLVAVHRVGRDLRVDHRSRGAEFMGWFLLSR